MPTPANEPSRVRIVEYTHALPTRNDGISFAPTLLGAKDQPPRPLLYRESPGYTGQQCVRVGDYKAIRRNPNPPPRAKDPTPGKIELYDLAHDPAETTDIAADHPDMVAQLSAIMTREHVKAPEFPMKALDGTSGAPEVEP